MRKVIVITDHKIINKIYFIRGKKIMVDRDLAEMYGVEAKRLKESVRRNLKRFPKDFMFEMTSIELKNWRTQIASSNNDKMGLRYKPYCFTEQGVAMLSSVLNSDTAIEVNIKIIRIFSQMREMLSTHKDILLKLEQIERNMMGNNRKVERLDEEIQIIFKTLKQLLHPPQLPRKSIGFKRADE